MCLDWWEDKDYRIDLLGDNKQEQCDQVYNKFDSVGELIQDLVKAANGREELGIYQEYHVRSQSNEKECWYENEQEVQTNKKGRLERLWVQVRFS